MSKQTVQKPATTDRVKRHKKHRIKRAVSPIAVASVVALTSSSVGLVAAPLASATSVQKRLVREGYLEPESATGSFDPRTGAAVAQFQADNGLSAHGIVDSHTADLLLGQTQPRSSK